MEGFRFKNHTYVTLFIFLKISTNFIEFVFTMFKISTPKIISPFFLVTLVP